jgi:hypothetical protein
VTPAAVLWRQKALASRCVICGSRRTRGHHIITQQQLRHSHPAVYDDVRWDLRNQLALCDAHHVDHHSRRHAIPLHTVLAYQPRVLPFARQLDLLWYLERRYPTTPALKLWMDT